MLVEEPNKRKDAERGLVFNPRDKTISPSREFAQNHKKQSNEAKLQKSKAAYQISHPIESYVYEKAPFWRLVLAVLINILLFYLFMIFSIFFHNKGDVSQILITVFPYFVFQLFFIFRYGQTIGKRIMGLFILNAETGKKIGAFHYLMREGESLIRMLNPFSFLVTLFSTTYANSIIVQKVTRKK